MLYEIDYTRLRELALAEISAIAGARRTDEGNSLYDRLIPYSNDEARLDAFIDDAASQLQMRTHSISRFDYAHSDKYYVIGSGGTRFLIRDDNPTSASQVYHPDFTLWPGTLQVITVSSVKRLQFVPEGMAAFVAGDFDPETFVYNNRGKAISFYVPDIDQSSLYFVSEAIDRFMQLSVSLRWLESKGLDMAKEKDMAENALQKAVNRLKTRKP